MPPPERIRVKIRGGNPFDLHNLAEKYVLTDFPESYQTTAGRSFCTVMEQLGKPVGTAIYTDNKMAGEQFSMFIVGDILDAEIIMVWYHTMMYGVVSTWHESEQAIHNDLVAELKFARCHYNLAKFLRLSTEDKLKAIESCDLKRMILSQKVDI